jgi:DDE_Tnp_1-associated/Transposase DDE domain
MDLTTFEQVEQVGQGSLAIDAASLYQAFGKVKDGRRKKGRRYPIELILTLVTLGKMAGEKTIEGVIDWVNERKKELKRLLNWPKVFPTNKTYTDTLAKCDYHEIAKVIAQVIVQARETKQYYDQSTQLTEQKKDEEETLTHVAVDGKALRGTRKHERENQPPVHLLSFYECESGIVLDHFSVEKKKNEYSTCVEILHPSLVKDHILTSDAGIGYKGWCEIIHALGGYYEIPIKNNHPVVRKKLIDFFQNDGADRMEFQYHKETSKGHGRQETREIWTSTQMSKIFQKEWAGIAQVFMIRRSVIEKGEERIEIVYGLTSLPRKKADAERILQLNRKHWAIENRLHYRRDVTLGEDASQVRVKGAPEVLAALNGGILALMDFLGVKNVAKQMRHYCAQYQEALQLLLGGLCSHIG